MILVALVFTAPPQVIQAYVLAQGYGHSFFGTMVAAIPLLTILVSVPMLSIVPTTRELVGVLGGLACMWLIVEDGVHRGMSFGLLALTFVVPLSSALSNTYIKWKLPHVPAAPLTTTLLIVAGFALLPLQLSTPTLEAMHIAGPTNAARHADRNRVPSAVGRRWQRHVHDGVRLDDSQERSAVRRDDDVRRAGARAALGHVGPRDDQPDNRWWPLPACWRWSRWCKRARGDGRLWRASESSEVSRTIRASVSLSPDTCKLQ